MSTDYYPAAIARPIKYFSDAGLFTVKPRGWCLHVQEGNGSLFNTFNNLPTGSRRFSHFWVSKLGIVEQYAPISYKSWAMVGGNPFYWSVETEGMPSEPLSPAQIMALAKLHVWLGAADNIAVSPTDVGITCHYIGGAAWGGHSCPDPQGREGKGPRSLQRSAILSAAATIGVPVMTTATVDGFTPAAMDALTLAVAEILMGGAPAPAGAHYRVHVPASDKLVPFGAALSGVWEDTDILARDVAVIKGQLASLLDAVTALAAPTAAVVDPAVLATAVRSALADVLTVAGASIRP